MALSLPDGQAYETSTSTPDVTMPSGAEWPGTSYADGDVFLIMWVTEQDGGDPSAKFTVISTDYPLTNLLLSEPIKDPSDNSIQGYLTVACWVVPAGISGQLNSDGATFSGTWSNSITGKLWSAAVIVHGATGTPALVDRKSAAWKAGDAPLAALDVDLSGSADMALFLTGLTDAATAAPWATWANGLTADSGSYMVTGAWDLATADPANETATYSNLPVGLAKAFLAGTSFSLLAAAPDPSSGWSFVTRRRKAYITELPYAIHSGMLGLGGFGGS